MSSIEDDGIDPLLWAIIEAAEHYQRGDSVAAIDRLIDFTRSEADGFAMSCALANGIAAQVDGAGTVMTEVFRLPGADARRVAQDEDSATLAASLIAATGNGDWPGALAVWRASAVTAQVSALVDLFGILMARTPKAES